jgi:hypothetical protein
MEIGAIGTYRITVSVSIYKGDRSIEINSPATANRS